MLLLLLWSDAAIAGAPRCCCFPNATAVAAAAAAAVAALAAGGKYVEKALVRDRLGVLCLSAGRQGRDPFDYRATGGLLFQLSRERGGPLLRRAGPLLSEAQTADKARGPPWVPFGRTLQAGLLPAVARGPLDHRHANGREPVTSPSGGPCPLSRRAAAAAGADSKQRDAEILQRGSPQAPPSQQQGQGPPQSASVFTPE
ncbi:hypothetical protein Efla_006346 [Eimeria flavescens]